jgi:hypothetical protein
MTVPRRTKAVRATLSTTAAGFHTALPSYFTHRDLFPALMKVWTMVDRLDYTDMLKYVHDCDDASEALPAIYLLGLLANYNKFEFQNPYRLRLDDFVNSEIIQNIVKCFGSTCAQLRGEYIAVQDDMPEGWTIGSTLSYIGLGALAPTSRASTPVPAPEEAKSLFAAL